MKLFNYNIKAKGTDLKILVLSDIHYYKNKHKLKVILNYVKNKHFDYIFLVGDIIDSSKTIDNLTSKQNIINFLDNLSQEAKIFISFGSHDEWDYLSKSVTKKYNTLKNTIEESLKDNSQICFKENIPYILDKNKTLTIINPSLKYAINRDNKEEIISDEVNKYTFLKK